jgi:hypothetical protein
MTFQRPLLYIIITFTLISCVARGNERGIVTFLIQDRNIAGADGQFVARTNNPALIDKARKELARPVDKRRLHLNGELASGNDDFNLGWHWHIVDNKWDLVEVSVELCDGTPNMVENKMSYWIEKVKRFCPWNSYISSEIK